MKQLNKILLTVAILEGLALIWYSAEATKDAAKRERLIEDCERDLPPSLRCEIIYVAFVANKRL